MSKDPTRWNFPLLRGVLDATAWRAWLNENHLTEAGVCLVVRKKHAVNPGPTLMSANERMRVAICFGWIDTTVRRLSEDEYVQQFVKRSSRSKWSLNTLRYAEEEHKLGRLSAFGFQMWKEGERKGAMDAPVDGLSHDAVHPDFEEALQSASSKARKNWERTSASQRKMANRWINSAKRTETRACRIKATIDRARAGLDQSR